MGTIHAPLETKNKSQNFYNTTARVSEYTLILLINLNFIFSKISKQIPKVGG